MKINRKFTKEDKNVFHMFDYEMRPVKLKSAQKEFEAPSHWSYNASNIFGSKYLYKTETSVKQVIHRMVNAWADGGIKCGMFDTDEDAHAFYDEISYMMLSQAAAPNSPQFFNTGINQYTMGSESDHYYVDTESNKVVKSQYEYDRPQLHACFIQSVDDNMLGDNGIYELLRKEARVFKSGSGSGTNFSKIRSEGEPLSSGGRSSGLMSFLDIYDKSAKSIKSGGTTRRSAKMVVVDADHPDIIEFIRWKSHEEHKAALLSYGSKRIQTIIESIKQMVANDYTEEDIVANVDGDIPINFIVNITRKLKSGENVNIHEYDTGFESEVYATVSGQSSNNTVRLPYNFIKDATTSQPFKLRNRTNGATKIIQADDLLTEIARANWETGDPGVHYEDNINFWNTCSYSGEIRSSNPCSEYMFLDDTSCNLASLNIAKFITYDERTSKSWFDVDMFIHAVRLWAIVLDISVEIAHFPSAEIARNTYDFRTMGLGITNLGASLMLLGYPYGSYEAQVFTRNLCSLMTAQAYMTSADMARDIGCFNKYEENKDSMMRVIHNHRAATMNEPIDGYDYTPLFKHEYDTVYYLLEYIHDAAVKTWSDVCSVSPETGFRNAQATLIAPTGTISFIMDCDTTGIEPCFSLVSYKQLVGGDYIKSVNGVVQESLRRQGYDDHSITEIVEGIINDDYTYFDKLDSNVKNIFLTAMPNYKGQSMITHHDHLNMMASAQPVISGAISKTVNLPNSATVEDVKQIFITAKELGLKSITVYRDNSKLSQPLSVKQHGINPERKTSKTTLVRGSKEPLPYRRAGGFTQKAIVSGHKLYIKTGEYDDGRLGEVFIDMHKEGAILHSLMNSFAMSISIGLQHGVPLEEYVSTFVFSKCALSGSVIGTDRIKMCSSIPDFIFRLLAIEYLNMQELAHVKHKETPQPSIVGKSDDVSYYTGDVCPSCGSFRMERSGTCSVCRDCGSTTGCS